MFATAAPVAAVADVTLINCVVNFNKAVGGEGGDGADGSDGGWGGDATGGIYTDGAVLAKTSDISCNGALGGKGGDGGDGKTFGGDGGQGGNGGEVDGGGIFADGNVTIDKSTVNSNTRRGGAGGTGGPAGDAETGGRGGLAAMCSVAASPACRASSCVTVPASVITLPRVARGAWAGPASSKPERADRVAAPMAAASIADRLRFGRLFQGVRQLRQRRRGWHRRREPERYGRRRRRQRRRRSRRRHSHRR